MPPGHPPLPPQPFRWWINHRPADRRNAINANQYVRENGQTRSLYVTMHRGSNGNTMTLRINGETVDTFTFDVAGHNFPGDPLIATADMRFALEPIRFREATTHISVRATPMLVLR